MSAIVTALGHASRRTKNRIREHGPRFTQRDRRVPSFPQNRGVEWVLLVNEGWTGWVPADEVDIQEVSDGLL